MSRLGPRGAPSQRGWRGRAAAVLCGACPKSPIHLSPHTSTPLHTAQAEPAAVAGVEFGWDTAEPAAAPSLALEQRCAKLEAELAALRARLHEAEARCATQGWLEP